MLTRRWFHFLIVAATWTCAAAALGVLLLAAARLGLNDRFRWSQYLFWAPAVGLLVPAAGLWIASSLLALAASSRRGPAFALRVGVGAGCALLALHIAFFDYRLHNRLLGSGRSEGAPTVRILNWNASGVMEPDALFTPIIEQQADIVITVDSCCTREWSQVAEWLGSDVSVLHSVNMKLMSRYPIRRYAFTSLHIPSPEVGEEDDLERQVLVDWLGRLPLLRHAAPPDGLRPRPDSGRAWYIEFDTTSVLGRTLVVWLIDMPSDIRLGRSEITEMAARVIRQWEGQEMVLREDGVVRQAAGPGFAAPDLILGDFNITRDSASLEVLTLGYPHAHRQTGWGHAGTYPRHRPLVHIDHCFVGPALRAVRYEIVDPGAGSHRMQVLEVQTR